MNFDELSGHNSVKPADHEIMRGIAQSLTQAFPDCTVALFIAPPAGAAAAPVRYITNGKRREMVAIARELSACTSGQPAGESSGG